MKYITAAIVFMAAAAPVFAQAPLPLRMDQMVARTDSIIVRMSGTAVGWQRYGTEKTAEGFVLTEETVTPGGGQKTRVVLDGEGAVRSVKQEGTGRGAAVFTDIIFSNGKVTGRHATMSAPGKTDTASIDMDVAAGAVDDNTLQHLFPALPWAPNAAWTFPYFSSGKRAVATRTLKVTAEETVTVPAGTFGTYRAEMDTGDGNIVTFNVTRARPNRVVQIRLNAMPVDFVLAK